MGGVSDHSRSSTPENRLRIPNASWCERATPRYHPFGRPSSARVHSFWARLVRIFRAPFERKSAVGRIRFQGNVQVRIVLLGTSSAVPTLTRGLSATALVREGDVFLFDCGEGTQLQLMRSTVKRSRIHSIFIGHLHGDHLYGIAGLLSTLHLDGREAPLNVFGPEGLRVFLSAAFRTSDLQFSFKVTLKEFPRGFRGRVLDEDEFFVEALPLDHSIFCLGWRFQEKDKPGTFNLESAEELGIPRGPLYGQLQGGESITLANGRVITPDMVLGPPRPGKSVAYCLDTQFSER